MNARRQLVEDLLECAWQVGGGADPAMLATPDTEAALAVLARRSHYDVQAATAVAAVNYWRFQTLPGAAADAALQSALDAFVTVGMAQPEAVPDQFRPMLDAVIGDPEAWYARAIAVLQEEPDPEASAYAIRLLRRVTDEAPADCRHRGDAQKIIAGLAGTARATIADRRREIDTAVASGDIAFLPSLQNNLATALMGRNKPAALGEAVELLRAAWSGAPDDYPQRSTFARNLALALRQVFEASQRVDDLRAAIDAAGTALLHTSQGHPSYRKLVGGLTELLRTWTSRTGRLPDDDVVPQWEAIAAEPDLDDRGGSLMDLSVVLRDRYERDGRLEDLHRSILANERAVQVTTDARRLQSRRFDLAVKLAIRYEHTRASPDLDRALDLLQDVVADSSSSHHNFSGRLSEFGAAVHLHFGRTRDPADLDVALDLAERALAAAGTASKAYLHVELAILYSERHGLNGEPADLDRAVKHGRRAVRAASPGERAAFVSKLAGYLSKRGELRQDRADLNEALAALRSVDPEGPDGVQVVANTGQVCVARHEVTGDPGDLDGGIEHLRRAYQRLGPEHRFGVSVGVGLARALCVRYNRTGDNADLAEALATAQPAARSPAASPRERLDVASLWAQIASVQGDLTSLNAALAAQVACLPELAERRLRPALRRRRLQEIQGLTSDAAAVALRAGDVAAALQSLEDGRGILLAQALETHAELDALHAAQPAQPPAGSACAPSSTSRSTGPATTRPRRNGGAASSRPGPIFLS